MNDKKECPLRSKYPCSYCLVTNIMTLRLKAASLHFIAGDNNYFIQKLEK